MTRKSKRQNANDDELEKALKNPNATVHYNYDGTWYVDYRKSSPPHEKMPEHKDYFNKMYNVHLEMRKHCEQQGLALLDTTLSCTNFCKLVHIMVPETRPEDLLFSIDNPVSLPETEPKESNTDGWTVVQSKK